MMTYFWYMVQATLDGLAMECWSSGELVGAWVL